MISLTLQMSSSKMFTVFLFDLRQLRSLQSTIRSPQFQVSTIQSAEFPPVQGRSANLRQEEGDHGSLQRKPGADHQEFGRLR